jgi:hypothetical protein
MALLLTPFRWLLSSILRAAIVVAILIALYFLLLRPAIDSGERKASHSLHTLEKNASPKRLAHCLEHAGGDLDKMKRCTRIF